MKKGLVLEGGGMRGLFTAGVTDVLMENGIEFDGMIGVSAGAAFGCNIKSRQIGRAIRYNVNYCKDPRYCSLRSLLKTGNLFGKEFCYYELPQKLDLFDKETFDNNPMEFYLVCTDVKTGEPVYKKIDEANDECYEWICASASMPIVSNVVNVGGYSLLDGGISDSIPLKYFENIGYDKNLVILTQPKGYIKKKVSAFPLMKFALRKYPAIIKAMKRRHEMYNDTTKYITERQNSGDAFVICPDAPLEISRAENNPEKLLAVYNLGRKKAEQELEKIKKFFVE